MHYGGGGGGDDAHPATRPTQKHGAAAGYQQYNYNQPPQQYYPATPVNAQLYNPRQTQHSQATGETTASCLTGLGRL